MTTRGFREAEAEGTANLIAERARKPEGPGVLARVRGEVEALARFPVYGA
jgi:glycine hydroxymethyltransferase